MEAMVMTTAPVEISRAVHSFLEHSDRGKVLLVSRDWRKDLTDTPELLLTRGGGLCAFLRVAYIYKAKREINNT